MKGAVMVRGLFLALSLVVLLVVPTAHAVSASQPPAFFIETVVSQNGGSPSITTDPAGRPWIGCSVDGTMKFAVRGESGWSFETVPFEVNPKTGIVIDSTGSPAVCHWESSGVLGYVHRGGGPWVSESTGEGYFPEASALAVGPTGRPYVICIWSYHYQGYVTLTQRLGSGWDSIDQTGSFDWFNPVYAGVDLAVDNGGRAHAIVNPKGNEFYYRGRGDGTSFPDMEHFAIAVNSQHEPVVVYNVGNEIQIMTRESGLWVQFTVGTVGDCGGMDLAMDAENVLHLVYCDRSGGSDKVMYALRSAYGEPWQFHEVDGGAQVSIAVDGAGDCHIAYTTEVTDPAGYDLMYATTATVVPVKKRTWGSMKALFEDEDEGDGD
jgi:hypothetical protein